MTETLFFGIGAKRLIGILRREMVSQVAAAHPDPLLCEIIQEFSIKQGVGGSGSGLLYGSVPENRYNGARSGPGLGMV